MKLFPWRRDCDHRIGSFCRTYNRQRDAYIHSLQNEIQTLISEVADLNEGIAWHKMAGAALTGRLAQARQTCRDLEAVVSQIITEQNLFGVWSPVEMTGPLTVTISAFKSPTTGPAEWRRCAPQSAARRSNPEECRRD